MLVSSLSSLSLMIVTSASVPCLDFPEITGDCDNDNRQAHNDADFIVLSCMYLGLGVEESTSGACWSNSGSSTSSLTSDRDRGSNEDI